MVQNVVYIFLASFAALFPVMNPVGSGFIVNGFLEGVDDAGRKRVSKRIAVNCLMIGLGSLIAGHLILLMFGLAIPIIQIGGGFIICKTALGWLSDSDSTIKHEVDKADTINRIDSDVLERKLFYPISFPISIGPGSISVIFTLMAGAVAKDDWLKTGVNYLVIGLVIIVLCLIFYVFVYQGGHMLKKMGPSGSLVLNKLLEFV